jgi:hypothetical protein
MTDNISPDDIDAAQIAKLIREYNQTDDREEQRRIENQVLAETVWQTPQAQTQQEGLTLSRAQWERLYAEIPDDALEAKRILRSFYIERL